MRSIRRETYSQLFFEGGKFYTKICDWNNFNIVFNGVQAPLRDYFKWNLYKVIEGCIELDIKELIFANKQYKNAYNKLGE